MVRLSFALVPSPLLGPEAWGPVAQVLRSGGWSVLEPAGAAEPPSTPGGVLKRFLAALPTDRDLVLVPHSSAGLYVPELTRKGRVIGYVFVDAILPPDGGTVPVAPQHLVTELASLADESGILPPWTAWWGEDDLRGLYPDPDTRGRIEEQAPRIPVRYLRSTISLPMNWNRCPAPTSPSATPMPRTGPPLSPSVGPPRPSRVGTCTSCTSPMLSPSGSSPSPGRPALKSPARLGSSFLTTSTAQRPFSGRCGSSSPSVLLRRRSADLFPVRRERL
jgi:hypothetical protein